MHNDFLNHKSIPFFWKCIKTMALEQLWKKKRKKRAFHCKYLSCPSTNLLIAHIQLKKLKNVGVH